MNPTAPATTTSASSPIRWSACLIAGLSSAVIAVKADAAIVTINLASAGSGPTNITGLNAGKTFGDSKTTVSNFVTSGTLEIFYSSGGIGLDGDGDLTLAITGGLASPRNYASGATIDGTATFSGSDVNTWFYYGLGTPSANAPNFGVGSFMGFRFGSSGNFFYGYIEVLWTWTGTPSTSSFQLLSAAYESTANTGIIAGAGAAPVPGAGGLMGLMALGGGAFRRRGRAAPRIASRTSPASRP